MKRLLNKVAIVTGAANGMGKETALLMAKEGATVVATDINVEALKILKDNVPDGHTLITMKHDVSSREDCQKVIDFTIKEFGKIDILVNNAGISMAKMYNDVTVEDWDLVMRINVSSIFYLTQMAIPHMQKAGNGGSIVNIASMASLVGNSGSGPYTASKGAVRSLSRALAVDYAHDKIRVNTIHPGYIATEMTKDLFANEQYRAMFEANTPLPYLGESIDIANTVVFLASDEAKFITGIDLPVDGGVVAR